MSDNHQKDQFEKQKQQNQITEEDEDDEEEGDSDSQSEMDSEEQRELDSQIALNQLKISSLSISAKSPINSQQQNTDESKVNQTGNKIMIQTEQKEDQKEGQETLVSPIIYQTQGNQDSQMPSHLVPKSTFFLRNDPSQIDRAPGTGVQNTNNSDQNKGDSSGRAEGSVLSSDQVLRQKVRRKRNKGIFVQEDILSRGIKVLIYKEQSLRSYEDYQILLKATEEMQFFKKLNDKKSNIQNNLHLNLCQAFQFRFVKKGGIVFYGGAASDSFYITLQGLVCVLINKSKEQQEIQRQKELEMAEEKGFSPKKDNQTITLRKRLLLLTLARAFRNLRIIMHFWTILQNQIQARAQRLKQMEEQENRRLVSLQSHPDYDHPELDEKLVKLEQEIDDNSNQIQIKKLKQLNRGESYIYDAHLNSSDTANSHMHKTNNTNNVFKFENFQVGNKQKKFLRMNSQNPSSPELSDFTINRSLSQQFDFQLNSPAGSPARRSALSGQENGIFGSRNSITMDQLSPLKLASLQKPLTLGGEKGAKLYKEKREELLKIVPQLDLDYMENPGHYFDENNVFKYKHAVSLGGGFVFGELGIINQKPRAGTITCLEDTYFAFLSAEDYERILLELDLNKLNAKIRFIFSTINKRNMSHEALSKKSQYFQQRKFMSGELICCEGDPAETIFLIQKGEAEIEKEIVVNYGGIENQINVGIGIIGERQYIGDDDYIFDRKNRQYGARVLTPQLSAYFIQRKQFHDLVISDPAVIQAITERVTDKETWRQGIVKEFENTRNLIKNIDEKKRKRRKKKPQHKSENDKNKNISSPKADRIPWEKIFFTNVLEKDVFNQNNLNNKLIDETPIAANQNELKKKNRKFSKLFHLETIDLPIEKIDPDLQPPQPLISPSSKFQETKDYLEPDNELIYVHDRMQMENQGHFHHFDKAEEQQKQKENLTDVRRYQGVVKNNQIVKSNVTLFQKQNKNKHVYTINQLYSFTQDVCMNKDPFMKRREDIKQHEIAFRFGKGQKYGSIDLMNSMGSAGQGTGDANIINLLKKMEQSAGLSGVNLESFSQNSSLQFNNNNNNNNNNSNQVINNNNSNNNIQKRPFELEPEFYIKTHRMSQKVPLKLKNSVSQSDKWVQEIKIQNFQKQLQQFEKEIYETQRSLKKQSHISFYSTSRTPSVDPIRNQFFTSSSTSRTDITRGQQSPAKRISVHSNSQENSELTVSRGNNLLLKQERSIKNRHFTSQLEDTNFSLRFSKKQIMETPQHKNLSRLTSHVIDSDQNFNSSQRSTFHNTPSYNTQLNFSRNSSLPIMQNAISQINFKQEKASTDIQNSVSNLNVNPKLMILQQKKRKIVVLNHMNQPTTYNLFVK